MLDILLAYRKSPNPGDAAIEPHGVLSSQLSALARPSLESRCIRPPPFDKAEDTVSQYYAPWPRVLLFYHGVFSDILGSKDAISSKSLMTATLAPTTTFSSA